MRIALCLFLLLPVSTSDAKQRGPMSREEAMAVFNRTYAGKSPAQVFEAIGQVFRLADGKDVVFEYPNPRTMTVTRDGGGFPMALRFTWSFDVAPVQDADAVTVTASLRTAASRAFTRPGGGTPTTRSPDVIELFFSRLSYFMGENETWMGCKEFRQSKPQVTPIDALCFKAADLRPDPSVS